ncbi:hypothetical protein GOP47_0013912 [Adiantum capillus-veneris]|uniref:Nudix hydrolase domain-containing protein n=1 Tax=Adiantum capillus-veneris TaxID=13818 RepID=A0A9D4UPM6_ADICA|nr:hypothetical protein GOP47_0013912 [Adiantum capillus-veneris]
MTYECVAGLAFEILLACPSGLAPCQLQVDFGSSYDRQPHPDGELERSIEKTWRERLQDNPALFNGLKFRYGGYKLLSSEQSGGNDVCLCLGLTDYKTFVGTNLSPKWKSFLKDSQDDIERCKHTSSPLGNGAIVETDDNSILVLKRSDHVGEFPGHLVFPGGHSEPQEIGILGHHELINNVELSVKIVDEMYSGIVREIVEETGVPATFLSKPLLLGVSRRVLNARPTAFFFVKCALSSPDILQFYKHAEHKFESTQLLSISKEDLTIAAGKMPGCHQGGAALFDLMEKRVITPV